MYQKWSPRAMDFRHAPLAVDARRSVRDAGVFPSRKKRSNKSELVAGTFAPFGNRDGEVLSLAIGLKKHQLNSKLVVGVGAPFGSSQQLEQQYSNLVDSHKADVKAFTKPQTGQTTQSSYTGVTLHHYLRDGGDIMCFPEPVLSQSYQHHQQHHTEDRGVIWPPSSPSSTDAHVNDSVLDVDKRVRLTTRGEVLEYLPSNDMYKVSTSWSCELRLSNHSFL